MILLCYTWHWTEWQNPLCHWIENNKNIMCVQTLIAAHTDHVHNYLKLMLLYTQAYVLISGSC